MSRSPADELAGLTVAPDGDVVNEDVAIDEATIVVRRYGWTSTATPSVPAGDALDDRHRGRVALWAALGGGAVTRLTIAPDDYRVRDDVAIPETTIVSRSYGWTSTTRPPAPPRDDMDARHLADVAAWAARRGRSSYASLCRRLVLRYRLPQRLRAVVAVVRRSPGRVRRAVNRRARSPGRRPGRSAGADDLDEPDRRAARRCCSWR
jgi:hypothetical protein